MKNILILFTLFVAPILVLALVMMGMLFVQSKLPQSSPEITPSTVETPITPPTTCGDDICSRTERTENSCAEDCT